MKRYTAGHYYYPDGCELEYLIAYELNGRDNDRGALEATEATGQNCAEAIGRLVAVLHHKGTLSLDEVAEIVDTQIHGVESES